MSSKQPTEPNELMLPSPMLPGIALRLPQLSVIENLLRDALTGAGQRLYTLEQAHVKKYGSIPGGVSISSIRNCLAMQPRGGIPDGWCSGRKVWYAATIDEWCQVDDQHLAEYLAVYAPHLRVPGRIIEANKRHVIEYSANQEQEDLG